MPIYHVQDNDRPVWVLADSYAEAVFKWKSLISKENFMDIDDVEDPQGVHHVCVDDDFLP